MPSGRIDQSLYVGPFRSIERMNSATLYKPGELGKHIELGNKAYQLVQVDSGATAATSAGLPVCGHVAFWKDRANHIVTNDKAQCETTESSSFAGVFCSLTEGASGTASITPGYYGVIQQRGTHVGVLNTSGSAIKGDYLCATVKATSATATTTKITPGTAPSSTVVGVATASTSAVTTNYTPCYLGGFDAVDVP
jgi:hypothetical protein